MTDNLQGLDFNALKPLLLEFDAMRTELEGMRGTMAGFIKLIKQQDNRIVELESKLALYKLPDPDTALVNRLAVSSTRNRTLTDPPHVIAYAAHLRRFKGIPAQRIYKAGLLSQSKLHGLDKWENQHLLDFCELHDVMDVYLNGLSDSQAREIVPNYDDLKAYIDCKAQETE